MSGFSFVITVIRSIYNVYSNDNISFIDMDLIKLHQDQAMIHSLLDLSTNPRGLPIDDQIDRDWKVPTGDGGPVGRRWEYVLV